LNVELVLSARFENRDGAEDLHLCAIGQRLSRRLHRSPYWIACYTDWTGRRLKKSTKLTNKKNALDVALALEYGEEQARKGAFTEARLRALLEQTLEGVIGTPVQHRTARGLAIAVTSPGASKTMLA